MNAARAYRRLKEVEEKKLANRLMLLKLELAKAEKKIQETHKRTEEIESHQERIAEKQHEKIQQLTQRVQEQQIAQQITQAQRERQAIITRARVRTVQARKHEAARELHDTKREYRTRIEIEKEAEMKRAHEVMKHIRTQRLESLEQRKKEQLRQREEARRQFNERVQEEALKSRDAQEKVLAMEREELRLIRELEQAQQQQRQEYHKLETALATSKKTIQGAAAELKMVMAETLATTRRSPSAVPLSGSGRLSARSSPSTSHTPREEKSQSPLTSTSPSTSTIKRIIHQKPATTPNTKSKSKHESSSSSAKKITGKTDNTAAAATAEATSTSNDKPYEESKEADLPSDDFSHPPSSSASEQKQDDLTSTSVTDTSAAPDEAVEVVESSSPGADAVGGQDMQEQVVAEAS